MTMNLGLKMGGGASLEGTATETDVLVGKTFYNTDAGEIRTGTYYHGCVKLGNATSYNIKNLYPTIYDTLTTDNFIVQMTAGSSTKSGTSGRADDAENRTRCWAGISNITKSYNATTGVFTRGGGVVSGYGYLVNAGGGETDSAARSSTSNTPTYETWMYW